MKRLTLSATILFCILFFPAKSQAIDSILIQLIPLLENSYTKALDLCNNSKHLKYNGATILTGAEMDVFEYSGFPETFIHLSNEMGTLASILVYQSEWFNTHKSLMKKLSTVRRYDESGEIADRYWYFTYSERTFLMDINYENEYITFLIIRDY